MADHTLQTQVAARIDPICQEFEAAWQRGDQPSVEQFVAIGDVADREALRIELLEIELGYRRKCRETSRHTPETPLSNVGMDSASSLSVAACQLADSTDGDAPLSVVSNGQTRSFGDYELIEEIDRGGMGVVYKARQCKLNRLVALKMIKAGELADAEQVRRFYAEAEAAAKLDHAAIVPVYEVGELNGQHFYSMAFVSGGSLDDRVKEEGPLAPPPAAQLMKLVAEAVQFAHDNGIVHRDIKPQNILLDKQEQPRVADFGLAKHLQRVSELTVTGQVMGTPSYMPPEQAAGAVRDIGPASDVYSLGATLYFLLTGRRPFQTASTAQTIRQVIEVDPVPPRRLNPAIPRDLETICLKCLRKEPGRRYASAAALADDLGRWLAGKPIVARRVSRGERAWLWCKRRPVVAGLSAALLIVTTVGTWVAGDRQNAVYADSLVERLLGAPMQAVPSVVDELAPYRRRVDPKLREVLARNADANADKRLRAAIGLLPIDSSHGQQIYEALLASPPDEASLLINVLKPHSAKFISLLWQQLADRDATPSSRMRAAMALAAYSPPAFPNTEQRWQNVASFLTDQVLAESRQDPSQYATLVDALVPVGDVLLPALAAVSRDASRNLRERELATSIVANYAAAQPEVLVALIEEAEPEQFLTLFPLLEKHRDTAHGPLVRIVNETPQDELTQAERVALGRRRARAAITLLRQGEIAGALDALRVSDDPESLTQFVHGAGVRGVLPGELLACLDRTDQARQGMGGEARAIENRVLFGLLLTLGGFTLDDLPQPERDALLVRLAAWYTHDPSSAIHGASGWLLRRWGQDDTVKKTDETPTPYSPDREWFTLKVVPQEPNASITSHPEASTRNVDDHGIQKAEAAASEIQNPRLKIESPFYITFVVFPPGKYKLGSPTGEADRQNNEMRHQVEITRPFGVGDGEITWAQYNPFDGGFHHDAYEKQFDRTLTLNEPAFGLSWCDAVSYCRWLTRQAGGVESKQCYADPVSLEKDAEGYPEDWRVDLAKSGFRLPTAAEWEVACRGGTSTAWSFGNDVQLLAHYAWLRDNSGEWSRSPRELRPNPRGLLDIHGNLWEWCHDRYGDYADDTVDAVGPPTGPGRVRRGGSFLDETRCRSAIRQSTRPADRYSNLGFRLAVTIPSSNSSKAAEPPTALSPQHEEPSTFDVSAGVKKAEILAETGEWVQSAHLFEKAAAVDQRQRFWWLYFQAVAQFASGRNEAYRATWMHLYDEFKDADGGEQCGRIVYAFVFGNPEPKLSSKVVEIAERYAKNTPAWKRVVGAALFRDAQFERAIQEFTDASKHFKSGAWDNFFMAMAYARTGRADLARQAFDTGLAELAIPNKKVPWFSRIEEEALRNEAERVLREPQRDLNE